MEDQRELGKTVCIPSRAGECLARGLCEAHKTIGSGPARALGVSEFNV